MAACIALSRIDIIWLTQSQKQYTLQVTDTPAAISGTSHRNIYICLPIFSFNYNIRQHRIILPSCFARSVVHGNLNSLFLSGRVPMRRLVYRVQPLPQSMLPLVWDFGQLNTQVEDLYIRQMVRRYVRIFNVVEQ